MIYLLSVLRFKSIKKKRDRVRVLNRYETIDYIMQNHCSISRFGDGEFDLVMHEKYGGNFYSNFQNFDSSLAQRLLDILSYDNPVKNHVVGLPACIFSIGTNEYKYDIAEYWNRYIYKNIDNILDIVNESKTYIDSTFTRFYMDYKDSSHCIDYINKMKELWRGRNLLIVEGDKSRLGVGNDLFLGANSIRRILCPSVGAYDKYNEILQSVKLNATKDDMIIIALGMTATVLAYDLSKIGFQALDMGHVDIEYEWFRMGAKEKVAIKGKFTNESSEGKIIEDSKNETYLSQIICKIE